MWTAASNAMFGLLGALQSLTSSWGWAIILLTIGVRLALHPLNHKQLMSMQKMQKLQPRLKMLQEKYKDDKESLTKETMALYKENKVNPAAGCLPLLVQLPILILLFRVLMRPNIFQGASFFGVTLEGTVLTTMAKALALTVAEGTKVGIVTVVNGIFANPAGLLHFSVYGPNLLLLVLIGLVTWYQQKMSSSGNPQMAMMSWFMPLFMLFICLSLPGGVMLYWGASSFIGVAQQWWVLQKAGKEEKPLLYKEKPQADKKEGE